MSGCAGRQGLISGIGAVEIKPMVSMLTGSFTLSRDCPQGRTLQLTVGVRDPVRESEGWCLQTVQACDMVAGGESEAWDVDCVEQDIGVVEKSRKLDAECVGVRGRGCHPSTCDAVYSMPPTSTATPPRTVEEVPCGDPIDVSDNHRLSCTVTFTDVPAP
ncbi:hypothetical protein HPB50_000651 [Hyalomma asiaticum]|uniref:Uncharacterized protein n=1 Tax=Hyalomma asiaticum TaxID=266040 RepID=A0ACB7T8U4_HYAAI|nr:hypothetical protein HPB50_000651 [Hyalomma asiaticum]